MNLLIVGAVWAALLFPVATLVGLRLKSVSKDEVSGLGRQGPHLSELTERRNPPLLAPSVSELGTKGMDSPQSRSGTIPAAVVPQS